MKKINNIFGKNLPKIFWFNFPKFLGAFTLVELILYIAFVGFIGLASFSVLNQFFNLNKTLYSYKEFKVAFLDFEKDLTDLITSDYSFYTGGNKLILTGENLIGFICSGNILKASFDNNGNIVSVFKEYKNLPCNSLSGYYQTGINLDLNLKFKGTGLVTDYQVKCPKRY